MIQLEEPVDGERPSERPTVLHLTNGLTSGAVPHLLADLGPHLRDRYDLYAGALLGGGSDRVSRSTLRELSSAGIDPIRFRFDTEPFHVAARELYDALADVDVVHTHLVRSGVFGRVFATLADVPVVVSSEHGDHGKYSPRQTVSNALTLRLADQIVCVSGVVASSFPEWERRWLASTDRAVVHNGVDPATVRAADEAGIPEALAGLCERGPVVGTVGRAVPEKRHDVVVRALPAVKEQFPEARLVVVGDGPLAGDLRSLADDLGVSDSVVLTGWLEREETLSVLQAFDLFVMPSRSEGLPLAALEAMFAGKPILFSDNEIFRELGGASATYVDGEAEAWAAEIARLLGDPDARAANATRCSERASEHFSPEAIAASYDRLYSEHLTKEVPE